VDYQARFLELNWGDIRSIDSARFVSAMQAHIAGDDPIYPPQDDRFLFLHRLLYRLRVDPTPLLPLLGPRAAAEDIDGPVMKRDNVAMAVLTSFLRRIYEDPDDPYRPALFDAVAYAGVHFSFDPLYGDAHTATSTEVSDFFLDPEMTPSGESRRSILKHLDELLAGWRRRVTEKASTSLFGALLRHLGAEGATRLFAEWKHMSDTERYNLLKQVGELDDLGPTHRRRIVDALLDPSFEVREAAFESLQKLEAPLGDTEVGLPEEELRKSLPALRRWAAKTDS